MAAGGPVDPTMPIPPDPARRGAPQPPEAGDDPTGAGGLPGAYDPTIAVPPVVPPDGPGGPGDDGFDDEGDDNRKWIYGGLAALGVIILGVIIALLVSGGGSNDKKASTSTSSSSSTSTSTSTSSTSTTSTTATTAPGAPVITSYSSNPATTVSCPNTSAVVPITLTWATANASGVTITIDGGSTASFGPSGSAARDFNCALAVHAYTLTAMGASNTTAAKTISLTRQTPATTLPPPTAPPTTTTSH